MNNSRDPASHLADMDEETTPCSTADPDAWHPEPNDHGASKQAQMICRGEGTAADAGECPLRLACFRMALSTAPSITDSWGVWGGTTALHRINAYRLMAAGVPLRDIDPDDCRVPDTNVIADTYGVPREALRRLTKAEQTEEIAA